MNPRKCPLCGRGLSSKWRAAHDVRVARRIRRRPDYKSRPARVCLYASVVA